MKQHIKGCLEACEACEGVGLYAHHFSPAFSSLFSFRVARWPQAVGEHCRKVPTIDLKEPTFDGCFLKYTTDYISVLSS